MVTGIPAGVAGLGKAAYHDLGVFGTGRGSYQLDDIGKAFAKSEYNYYKPLLRGDFGGFYHNFHEKPLTIAQDLATIFTGGGAAVGAAGKAGLLGDAGRALAGMERLSPAEAVLIPGGQASGWAPRVTTQLAPGSNFSRELIAHSNPMVRGRRDLLQRFLNETPVVRDMPGLRLEDRVVKSARKVEARNERLLDKQLLTPLHESWSSLSKDERLAAGVALKGINPDDWIAAYSRKLSSGQNSLSVKDKANIRRRINELTRVRDSGMLDKLANPEDRLTKYVSSAKDVSDHIQDVFGNYFGFRDKPLHHEAEFVFGDEAPRFDPRLEPFRATVSHRFIDEKAGSASKAGKFPTSKPRATELRRESKGINVQIAADPLDRSAAALTRTFYDVADFDNATRRWSTILNKAHDYKLDELDSSQVGTFSSNKPFVLLDSKEGKAFVDQVNQYRSALGKASSELGDDHPVVVELQKTLDELGEGKVKVIPRSTYKHLVNEFRKSHKAIQAYKKGTDYWRALVLTYRPAWMVNNLVGNTMLLLAAHGPVEGARSLVQQRGELGKAVATPETGMGFSASQVKGLLGDDSEGRVAQITNKIGDFNSRRIDEPFRNAAQLANARPNIREMRKLDPSLSDVEAAQKLMANERFRNAITDQTMNQMIDFGNVSDLARGVFPFASWMKGMSKNYGNLFLNEPWKAWALNNVGQYGADENRRLYGQLPSFLAGMLVVGKDKNGNPRAITTQGLNPYQTVSDVAGNVAAFLPARYRAGGVSENPVSSMNPFVRSLFEAGANRNLFYDAPLEDHRYQEDTGITGRYFKSLFGGIPQVRLAQKMLAVNAPPDRQARMLFQPDYTSPLLAYFLGLPLRTVNSDVARARALEEATKGAARKQ